MADQNLYPSDGVWDVRFTRSGSPDVPVGTWMLEFHDGTTFCQSIGIRLNFTGDDHAKRWITTRWNAPMLEKRPGWFEGVVVAADAGTLLEQLWNLSAAELQESTPWYYGNRFGPGPALIEVAESGEYSLYDSARGRGDERAVAAPGDADAGGAAQPDIDYAQPVHVEEIPADLRRLIADMVDRAEAMELDEPQEWVVDEVKRFLAGVDRRSPNELIRVLAQMLRWFM